MLHQRQPRLAPTRYPNLVLWICFWGLNSLLFLPAYMLNLDTSTFLPLSGHWGEGVENMITRLAIWRENSDLFRVNVELVLLLALWVNVGWVRKRGVALLFALLFTAIYLLALVYYIYESVMVSLFFVEPVFYNQYHMLTEGVQFLLEHMQLSWRTYIVAGALLLGGGLTIYSLIRTLMRRTLVDSLNRWSKVTLATLAALALVATARYQVWSANPEMTVSSLFFKLEKNISESLAIYGDMAQFDDAQIQQAYDYSAKKLRQKPNIYLIFIESYGSVLYKRPDWRIQYPILLRRLEKRLADGGWHPVSHLSAATTWGGGSWMSYTSAMFGLRIDSDPQFLALFDKYQTADYPDIGSYLRSQGYRNVRLSSISSRIKEEKWVQYEKFYETDKWLRYQDLGYIGARYGWGPAPPDQYALSFTQELLKKESDQPFLLFFITQNSHYPFALLPEVVDDWHTLNVQTPDPEPPDLELIDHEVRRENYFNSIKYELEFLTEFMLTKATENDIFVLVGDHQPPRVSRRNDGWETPMHIISRNPAFADSFKEYGFVDGLTVRDIDKSVKHEGFYSMFTRALLANYGENPTDLPDYLPDGVLPPDVDQATDQVTQPESPLD